MGNQNEDKEKTNEAALPEPEVTEEVTEEKEDMETVVKEDEAEEVTKEETAEAEETEQSETAEKEPEAAEEAETAEKKPEAAEEPAPDETQIITDEMKKALDKEEEEEITSAKIQAGLNEAAEEFKAEQELSRTMEEGKTMKNTEIKEEAAEVKTVYIKEKKRTGWWKIVMLILTILITLTFGATALFTGLGTWQLYRIAEHQEKVETPAQTVPDPYYYGGQGSGQYGNNSDYYDDYYNSDYGYGNGKEDYDINDILEQYGIDEDFDWDEIGQYFNDGGSNSGSGSSGSSWKDDVSDLFTSIFGSDDGSGATQGF